MIVMKFGGSSLSDPESLKHIASIILKSSFSRRIVVLSAVQGITDRLISATDTALHDESSIETSIEAIYEIHRPMLELGLTDPDIRKECTRAIQGHINKLKKLLKGVAYTGEATPRTRDQIVSYGERLSVHLMTGCLKCMGSEACPFESDKLDMLAHGHFGKGTVDRKVIRKKLPPELQKVLKRGGIPVITGFFGKTSRGETITFGRGGTDYSAAVVADAMGAERLEIWKDVDGFLSGSPEIVKNGQFLSSLSYDEAAELAYFGAKILHPRTVEPLLEQKIPIVIRNTFKPDKVGTWIGEDKHTSDQIVKSVTFDRNIAMIRLHGVDVGYAAGYLSSLVNSLSKLDINIRSVMTSQTCINILMDRGDLQQASDQLQKLDMPGIDLIEPIENIGLVAIVGEGLSKSEDLVARAIHALTRVNIHAEIIISGASKVAAYLIVREGQLKRTVRVVHRTFFNEGLDNGSS